MKYAKLIVDESEHNSDMRYACGFAAPDEFIFFELPNGGERAIVMSVLEFDRAKAEAKPGVNVYPEAQFGASGTIDELFRIAAKYSLDGFSVPAGFPLLLADGMRTAGLSVIAEPGEFWPGRQFKSRAEADEIVKALRATEQGMRRAFELIAAAEIGADNTLTLDGAPLTSELLRSAIELEFMKNGAAADSTIVAGGVQGARPHCEGSGQLCAGTPIVMDLFPRLRSSGYWGDLTRTVVKGQAPDIVKKAFDTVFEARENAKKMMRPGAVPADIHNGCADFLAAAGFHTGNGKNGAFGFFHGLGHGVGLDIHEAPRVNSRNRSALRGGEVVTVEPGVYYPEWGGIRLEDMVYITGSGCECLTTIDTFLEIK
ncbi:MAG: M24 family metallopeptidase [Victivallaceae bacterium]|nr:M24 family metallopeptidase [Victivallaceae bacterium]